MSNNNNNNNDDDDDDTRLFAVLICSRLDSTNNSDNVNTMDQRRVNKNINTNIKAESQN